MIFTGVFIGGPDTTDVVEAPTPPAPTQSSSPTPVSPPEPSIPAPAPEVEPSLAEKLAALDTRTPVEMLPDDLVRKFQRQIDALKGKCQDEETRLGDFTVKSQELLNDYNLDESLLSIITNVNLSIPDEYAELGVSCSDVFGAYVALRVNG
jgi:hypothetical protein